ncbi:MAG: type II 3-dehydroquinate dehydratase [Candidatus Caldatribacteriota bacterium]|nr:type II 3-dehydroquinate dehydratase [Candidatus Caldatribacteriota bacterium]
MLKIGIINGPNLNHLGKRDKNAYGSLNLGEINQKINYVAEKENMELMFVQSNSEGEIIDSIQKLSSQADGLIINPAAYTHYSYAIADALRDCPVPVIEVHLSNIFSREEFRQKSVTAPACNGQIVGLGYHSYILALYGLLALTK